MALIFCKTTFLARRWITGLDIRSINTPPKKLKDAAPPRLEPHPCSPESLSIQYVESKGSAKIFTSNHLDE